MNTFRIPANPTAADIDRVVAAARASRAETIRAASVELTAAIKRLFAGFHRPAPRKGAVA
jgi:hypothetical protein